MIRDGRSNINDLTEEGKHLIILAAHRGHAKVVQTLLHLGVDVNTKDTVEGVTPLFVATVNGHTNVVELLLQEKNVDIKTGGEDHSPLTVASWNRFETIVQLILHKYGRTDGSLIPKKPTTKEIFKMLDTNHDGK